MRRKLPAFRSLQTRLTVFYGLLFGLAFILTATGVEIAIGRDARTSVRRELIASGTVYERIWMLRSDELGNAAELLAHDYGFRAAAATRDAATVGSALQNLRSRLHADLAFVITADGSVLGIDSPAIRARGSELWTILDHDSHARGVTSFGGSPYLTVAAPIMSPNLQGWVLFAAKLDATEMRSLERLAALPLRAAVLDRGEDGHWTTNDRLNDPDERAQAQRFVLASTGTQPEVAQIKTRAGEMAVLARPLARLGGIRGRSALLLQYPLALAYAPYRALRLLVLLIGGGAFGIVLWASGRLSRGLIRPLKVLDRALRAMRAGETPTVAVTSGDEIGRLARSFNDMAGEIEARRREITHVALHDSATGLPNRHALEAACATLVGSVDTPIVVAAFAIERFEEIRGAVGFALADALVQAVGERLSEAAAVPVARVSNAVLATVFPASDAEAAAARIARVLEGNKQPVRIGGQSIDVALTAGFYVAETAMSAPSDMIGRASVAVDQARTARQPIARFDAKAYGDPASRLSLMGEMLDAVAQGHLRLFYQPKLDLRSGAVTSVEALIRWQHPTRGMLAPNMFIGLAEETGHIRALTEWVLKQAVSDQALMAEAGHDLRVSVNISGRLIGEPAFARDALTLVGKSAVRLCFEITETYIMEQPEVAIAIMRTWSDAGVDISIDDYGSGYSSLAYLKDIPASELKIDKVFIQALGASPRDAMLIRSTIDLAHGLGMKVVAEGVETGLVMAALETLGCDSAQGYFIKRPISLADMLAWLAERDHSRQEIAA